jgi:hypothetical protein
MCFSVEEPIVQVVSGVPRGDKSVQNVPSTSYNFGTGYLRGNRECTCMYCIFFRLQMQDGQQGFQDALQNFLPNAQQ